MTISLVVISFAAGIALAQWFRVLILVPAMSLVLVGTIAAGIARTDDVWSIALVAIAVVTALQIGYLIGIWLRSFIVGSRFPRASRRLTPTSEASRPPPTGVTELFARDLPAMTEYHDHEGQEHLIHRLLSRDRAQWRRKVGPTYESRGNMTP
jgi:hypothetical protein